jgi:hypothetical protein
VDLFPADPDLAYQHAQEGASLLECLRLVTGKLSDGGFDRCFARGLPRDRFILRARQLEFRLLTCPFGVLPVALGLLARKFGVLDIFVCAGFDTAEQRHFVL